MGIDSTAFEAILLSQKFVKGSRNGSISLARQQFHIPTPHINYHLRKHGYNYLENKYSELDYFENLFRDLGYGITDSIDFSSYEGANIIHNMNLPIPKDSKKYNYIYDGGTIEHIFNSVQVC